MAVRPIAGLETTLTLPNNGDGQPIQLWVQSLQIQVGQVLLDISHFGGAGWQTFMAGIRACSGSVVGILLSGDAGANMLNLSTTGGTLTIQYANGCSISFTALCGDVNIASAYAGAHVVSMTFAKSDDVAPTITWATT